MAAPAKSFTVIANSAVDVDSPIDEDLVTALRDNSEHLEEWVGKSYTAAVDHDHDGVNSAPVVIDTAGIGIVKCGSLNMSQGATHYMKALGTAGNGTEAESETYISQPTVFSQLRVQLTAAVPASQTIAVTLRKNGADTALTVTLTAGQTNGSDLSNSVYFDEEDRYSVKYVTSASFGTTNDACVTMVTKLANGIAGSNLALCWAVPASASQFSCGEASSVAPIPTETKAEVPLPAGYLLRTFLARQATGGSFTVHRDTAQITRPMTAVGISTGYEYLTKYFKENNLYNLYNSDGGSVGNCCGYARWSDYLSGTNRTMFTLFSSNDQPQNTTAFMGGYGVSSAATLVEANVQIPMPACTLKNLRVGLSAAPPAGQTFIITVRKNGSDTALTVTISSGERVKTDLVNTVAFAAGDLFSLKVVSSATAGTLSANACIEIVP